MSPDKEHIPARSATIPFYLAGALSFLLVSVSCLAAAGAFGGHFFQPVILAITHLAVLGWATMIIFGASNQLAPVIAEQKLYSEKLPVWVLVLLAGGTMLLVLSFRKFAFTWLSYTGGGMVLTSMILHSLNIYNTVRRAKENIIIQLLVTAHAWLLITASVGLLLLVNLRFPFLAGEHLQYLEVHAGIGMAGWFLQLVVGVSARLVPMFLLSREEKTEWLHVTYYTLNLSLAIFLVNGMLFRSGAVSILSLLMLLSGLLFYAGYIHRCYRSAMKKQTDQGMKQTLLALELLCIPFLLLFLISAAKEGLAPNIMTAYGFSFFGGFISTLIMGQTFKTLPFIVWMHITRSDKLPEHMPKDLYRERWVKAQMMLYLPGFLLFLTGILCKLHLLLYAGSSLMTVAAAWYFIHVLLVIKKLNDHDQH